MIKISVKHNIDDVIRRLTAMQREQVPFAASVAINRTAKRAQEAIKAEIGSVFDKPKPYTLGGTFVSNSNKRNLTAIVGLKDKSSGGRAAAKYLQAQVGGGTRRTAGYEAALSGIGALPKGWRVVPGAGAKLDTYGNLNQKQLTEIMGSLRSGFRQFKGKGKRQSLTGYFVARPDTPLTKHLEPGVYYRIYRAGASVIKPILIFTQSAHYRPVLDIYGLVSKTVTKHFDSEFEAALKQALATAR